MHETQVDQDMQLKALIENAQLTSRRAVRVEAGLRNSGMTRPSGAGPCKRRIPNDIRRRRCRCAAMCAVRLAPELGACPPAATGARHDWRDAQCVCGRRMGRRGRRGVAASLSPSNAAPVRACMPGRAPARHSGCDWREEEKGWGGWGDEGGAGSLPARPTQRRSGPARRTPGRRAERLPGTAAATGATRRKRRGGG